MYIHTAIVNTLEKVDVGTAFKECVKGKETSPKHMKESIIIIVPTCSYMYFYTSLVGILSSFVPLYQFCFANVHVQ